MVVFMSAICLKDLHILFLDHHEESIADNSNATCFREHCSICSFDLYKSRTPEHQTYTPPAFEPNTQPQTFTALDVLRIVQHVNAHSPPAYSLI